jgi:hypothetical protein
MKVFEIIERLEKINNCLKEEKTGIAKEFAAKIGVSRSMLFNYFDYLKSYDIEIEFERQKNSFVFKGDIEIDIQQPIRVLKDNELISTNGGEKIDERVQGNWTGLTLSSLCV